MRCCPKLMNVSGIISATGGIEKSDCFKIVVSFFVSLHDVIVNKKATTSNQLYVCFIRFVIYLLFRFRIVTIQLNSHLKLYLSHYYEHASVQLLLCANIG